MAIGMATQKITVTLDDGQVRESALRQRHGKRQTFPLSCGTPWVSLCTMRQDGKRCWRTRLQQTEGPLTKNERVWADAFLSGRKRGTKKGKAA